MTADSRVLPGLLALLVLSLVPARGSAQQTVDRPGRVCAHAASAPLAMPLARDFDRIHSLRADSPLRSRHLVRRSDGFVADGCAAEPAALELSDGISLRAAPLALGTWRNGGYAEDRDNGLVWAGRGWSSSLTGGAVARVGPLTAAWIPEAAWQQNQAFELVPRTLPGFSPYVNGHYWTIDLPQRFGDGSYTEVDAAGQSFVRVDAYGATLGWSHENLVVGPALRNPIVLSATAGGFHHLFAGTGRPLDLRIVDLELQAVLGRAWESELFDQRPDNDRSEILLWTAALTPHGLDGLQLGAARVQMFNTGEDDAWWDAVDELFGMLWPADVDPAANRMTSLWARWVLPRSGTEVYAEWVRTDDFSRWASEFITEPDHSQAYTLGFQRITPLAGGGLRLQAELTALQEKSEAREGRPVPIYYTHNQHTQGYTHEGQILGAGIGPGADAQFIAVDYFRSWGYAGAFVERVRRNDLSPRAVLTRFYNYEHDTAVTGGLRGLVLLPGDASLAATVSRSRRYNRDFLGDESNVQLVTELIWSPDLSRAFGFRR